MAFLELTNLHKDNSHSCILANWYIIISRYFYIFF